MVRSNQWSSAELVIFIRTPSSRFCAPGGIWHQPFLRLDLCPGIHSSVLLFCPTGHYLIGFCNKAHVLLWVLCRYFFPFSFIFSIFFSQSEESRFVESTPAPGYGGGKCPVNAVEISLLASVIISFRSAVGAPFYCHFLSESYNNQRRRLLKIHF